MECSVLVAMISPEIHYDAMPQIDSEDQRADEGTKGILVHPSTGPAHPCASQPQMFQKMSPGQEEHEVCLGMKLGYDPYGPPNSGLL